MRPYPTTSKTYRESADRQMKEYRSEFKDLLGKVSGSSLREEDRIKILKEMMQSILEKI